jgi:hypothetical protein
MGHLHVPRIQGHDPAALAKILKQTQAMLVEAVLGVE